MSQIDMFESPFEKYARLTKDALIAYEKARQLEYYILQKYKCGISDIEGFKRESINCRVSDLLKICKKWMLNIGLSLVKIYKIIDNKLDEQLNKGEKK